MDENTIQKKNPGAAAAIKKLVKNAASFIARFFMFFILRFVFFFPFILYTHLPTIVPNLHALRTWHANLLAAFCAVLIIHMSYRDARRRSIRPVERYIYFVIGAYTLLLWYPMFYIVNYVFRWWFPAIVVLTVLMLRRARRDGKPLYPVFSRAAVIPSCAAFIAATLAFTLTLPCGSDTDTPALHHYINYCDSSKQLIPQSALEKELNKWERKTTRRWYRTATPVDDTVFIGATGDFSFAYNFADGKVTKLEPHGGIFSLIYDRTSSRIFTASNYDAWIRIYSYPDLSLLRHYNFKGESAPYWLEFDEESRHLFAGCGETIAYRAIILHADTMEVLRKDPVGIKDGSLVITTADPRTGTVYFVVLFNTFHKNLLFSYDLKTLEVKKKVVIPAYLVGIHYSPALDRVFVCTAISKFNKSEIFELDPGTLEVRGKMKTPIGSRDISSDNNGFLYLSNYLNGNIYMIDWKEKKIIETINVGRKIKRMIFQPEKDIITFTSEHGYGFIDPEKMGLR